MDSILWAKGKFSICRASSGAALVVFLSWEGDRSELAGARRIVGRLQRRGADRPVLVSGTSPAQRIATRQPWHVRARSTVSMLVVEDSALPARPTPTPRARRS